MLRPHFLLAGALVVALPVAAQAGQVRNRETHQQHRIAQGIASGQITARGGRNLEGREARINQARQRDLAANGGHLTGHERATLNRRENRASNAIYRDKHNAVAQPGVTPYANR